MRRGVVEWKDVSDALARIAGNDINTFSSVLTQIQLVWQVLSFRTELLENGFPELAVSSGNALVTSGLDSPPNAFTVLDQAAYDAVVGNPPYIRPERNRSLLDRFSRDYFESSSGGAVGISAESDTYALFLSKALDSWCKREIDGKAGRVGFVIPLGLLDANENERLRKLFMIGGRWTIIEIVDLEIVYESVFDADTIPMIFIAEARPATSDDVVHIRLADSSAVRVVEGALRPEFDFEAMPQHDVGYSELFTSDGRIPTRITPARRRILDKIRFDRTLLSAAKPYWVKRGRSAWRSDPPPMDEFALWTERRMLTAGCVFRGSVTRAPNGLDVYKGENVVVGAIFGPPALRGIDIAAADDALIWRFVGDGSDRFPDILPHRAFAIAGVAHCPNFCPFDPRTAAFTDTARLFVPREEYADFPFDLLCLSNVYVYWFSLKARMGLLRTQRSHMYATNLSMLPWSDAIANIGHELEALRGEIVDSCRAYFSNVSELAKALEALDLPTVKERGRSNPAMNLTFSPSFDVPDFAVEPELGEVRYQYSEWILPLSRFLFDYIITNDERAARGIRRALNAKPNELVARRVLLNLRIPYSDEETREWDDVIRRFDEASTSAAMNAALAKLDSAVGKAMNLDSVDLLEIETDMQLDPFLSHVRPRYPGSTVRIQGLRKGLESALRYE